MWSRLSCALLAPEGRDFLFEGKMPEELTASTPAASIAPAIVTAPVDAPPADALPAPVMVPVDQPVGTPEQPASTAAPAEPAPMLAPEMEQYVAGLEQTAAETESRDSARIIVQAATAFARRLQEEQGLTPEQTAYAARREVQQALREFNSAEFRRGQINAAFDIGARHGIDPRIIMNLPTPQAMEQRAASVRARGAVASEVAKLKAEIETLKKSGVPPQNFASPGTAAQAPGSYIEAVKSGKPLPSAAQIDEYTRQWAAQQR